MAIRFLFSILGLGVSLGLASCALKAHAVPESPVAAKKSETKPTVSAPVTEPKPGPAQADDGIRLPQNMLGLPEEKDLKATNPSVPKSGDQGGSVISRPPVEKKD